MRKHAGLILFAAYLLFWSGYSLGVGEIEVTWLIAGSLFIWIVYLIIYLTKRLWDGIGLSVLFSIMFFAFFIDLPSCVIITNLENKTDKNLEVLLVDRNEETVKFFQIIAGEEKEIFLCGGESSKKMPAGKDFVLIATSEDNKPVFYKNLDDSDVHNLGGKNVIE